MIKKFKIFTFIIFCFQFYLNSNFEDNESDLFQDLLIVDYWNRKINDRLPVTYNHSLQGGYINMPSARMGAAGEIGFGYSSVPPYRNYNLRMQLSDNFEVTGNYRIFKGIDDPILTPLGFGDLSERGVNIKFALFCPEDSDYSLPGIAVGLEDFIGTKNFESRYIVVTKVFLDYNLEFSVGYGKKRIRGFFGGINWFPLRKACSPYLQGLCLTAEYDAVPYHKKSIEKHPKGRSRKTRFNIGLKYRLWDYIDFSVAYVRGKEIACSVSAFYNFGYTTGFLPKYEDPLPYQAPINIEPVGCRRPEDMLAQDLLYAFRAQGFELLAATMETNECAEQTLRLEVDNIIFKSEPEVRTRLNFILAGLIPENIDRVIVVIQAEGFPIQEYRYCVEYIEAFREQQMCAQELLVLTPLHEVSHPGPVVVKEIFRQCRHPWNIEILPKSLSFFGSARGKFKYALGISLGINGYLFNDVYYSARIGWVFLSNLKHLTSVDRLNPSQLPNVRSDIVDYYNQKGITVDELYMQKTWNMGRGWYTRIAGGLFEEEYGGIASEILYYPVNSLWAVGLEGAYLKKRTIRGVGFTDKVRQLEGFKPHFRKFSLSQYFLDFYFRWPEARLDFKVMVGQFLARDKGARLEICRYFPSGLRISCWFTWTDGHDKINGQRYHDRGIAFSMPMDIFYTYSDRSRWGYGMSAWLRDVGVFADTGLRLYDLIREQRD